VCTYIAIIMKPFLIWLMAWWWRSCNPQLLPNSVYYVDWIKLTNCLHISWIESWIMVNIHVTSTLTGENWYWQTVIEVNFKNNNKLVIWHFIICSGDNKLESNVPKEFLQLNSFHIKLFYFQIKLRQNISNDEYNMLFG